MDSLDKEINLHEHDHTGERTGAPHNHPFNVRRDTYDHRDLRFHHICDLKTNFPNAYNVKNGDKLIVFDQGQLGSCTANAGAAAYMLAELNNKDVDQKDKEDTTVKSRIFLYYNERKDQGDVNSDSGSSIRECMIAMNKYGLCEEKYCPYDIAKYTKQPGQDAYTNGKAHKVVKYARIDQDLNSIKTALLNNQAVNYGFMVYQNFQNYKKGQILNVPTNGQCLGWHAGTLKGFSDDKRAFLSHNSYGTNWGDNGCFWISYDYITNTNLAMDFWAIVQIQ